MKVFANKEIGNNQGKSLDKTTFIDRDQRQAFNSKTYPIDTGYLNEVKKESINNNDSINQDLRSFEPIEEHDDFLYLGYIKFLIPTKMRDEIIVDLYEVKHQMKIEGFTVKQISFAIAIQVFWICYGLLQLKFRDFIEGNKITDNNT